jgi:hypothetical protein
MMVVRMQTQFGLTVEHVGNGFIIRTFDGRLRDDFSGYPVKVAETPERLAEILSEWANDRVAAKPLS